MLSKFTRKDTYFRLKMCVSIIGQKLKDVNKKMRKMSKIVIGLDIGRAAVGYAVTDEDGVLKRFKGRNMWGISYFGDSRERVRCGNPRGAAYQQELMAIFAEQICVKDVAFFDRLETGGMEARAWWNKMTGGAHRASCPTIYHLRERLASDPTRVDLSLIYLAFSHILRYGVNAETGIAVYEKHHADLLLLKALYRRYAPKKYRAMFRMEASGVKNYSAYVKRPHVCGAEALYRTIVSDIGAFSADRDVAYCLTEMCLGSFLPRVGLCRQGDWSAERDAEVARILERQSVHEPFLAQNAERILSLFARSRQEQDREPSDRVRRAMRIMRALGHALGRAPDYVFFTCDGDACPALPSKISEDIASACGGSAVTYLPETLLHGVKRRNALIDSRLVNDFFHAQNAFFTASLGLCGQRCCGAMPWTEEKIRYAPEELDRMRRTFAFSDFFEAGIPETRRRCARADDISQASGIRLPLLQGRRVRYDGIEYAVSPSGTLLGAVQLVLSTPSVYILERLRTKETWARVSEEDYMRLYDEICEKIGRYQPYHASSAYRSPDMRSRFLRCSPAQKTVWIFKLLADARAGVPCNFPPCGLDAEKFVRIDKSAAGLFERGTNACVEKA